METAARQGNLPTLEYLLEQTLKSEPLEIALQVQCALKRGVLMVLVQHSADITLDASQVFQILERSLRSLELEFTDRIRLYLRAIGQKKPYAIHAFQLEVPVSDFITASSAATLSVAQTTLEPPLTDEEALEGLSDPVLEPRSIATITLAQLTDSPTETLEDQTIEQLQTTTLTKAFATSQQHQNWQEQVGKMSAKRSPIHLPFWIGSGVGVLMAIGVVYGLTRPCVIGQCTAIATAATLNQQSAQTQQTAQSGQDLMQAKQQLVEATRTLSRIPPWSGYYREAQIQLQTYLAQVGTLNRVLLAENIAVDSVERSKKPFLVVEQWQNIQSHWQDAIAQLEQVPSDSPLYSLAQQKLTAYRENLAAIGQRITVEQQAEKRLTAAKEAARVASARQGIAQSLENWQLAKVSWQTAIDRLQQIPSGTTIHDEAQQLLNIYQPQLAKVSERTTQEAISAKTYNRAMALAQQAQSFEQRNQWSQATTNWRNALNYANQVPTGTFYHEQSKSLVSNYTVALKQAEDKLQTAMALQTARADLKRVCAGSPKICNFTANGNTIQVQLTSNYERTMNTAIVIGRAGDNSTLGGAINHMQILREAFQTISNNAGIPLEVYNADGVMVDGFSPGN